MYCGKEDTTDSIVHSHKVVRKLSEWLIDEGSTINADYFHSGILLVEELLDRKTSYCGTLRSNRKIKKRRKSI